MSPVIGEFTKMAKFYLLIRLFLYLYSDIP